MLGNLSAAGLKHVCLISKPTIFPLGGRVLSRQHSHYLQNVDVTWKKPRTQGQTHPCSISVLRSTQILFCASRKVNIGELSH